MPITTDVSSNPAQGEVYNIVIKFVNDLRQVGGYSEYEIEIFFTGHSVWWTKMIHQTESTYTRAKEKRNFFNISLLMAGLYSFLYLYKAFFIVIDFNWGCFLISYTHVIWNQLGEEWYGNKNFHINIYSE